MKNFFRTGVNATRPYLDLGENFKTFSSIMARYARRRAYRRRPSTRPRRTYTTRTRRTRRPRARNNVNQLTMRAPLASRLLRIKLPWVKTFSVTMASGPSSNSFAFQGNAIVPYTTPGQTSFNQPAAGDLYPAGVVEYSQFYDKYFINGSSIKVEIVNTQSSSGGSTLIRAVLLAVPFIADGNDTWLDIKAQLDGYTYEQLLAWPYAKWRMLGANTGGSSRLIFKMFRKTKNMCGIKDLRDNTDYGNWLPDGTTQVRGVNPNNGFMYYLRLFTNNGTPLVEMTVRMSLYVTMVNREFNPVQTITN